MNHSQRYALAERLAYMMQQDPPVYIFRSRHAEHPMVTAIVVSLILSVAIFLSASILQLFGVPAQVMSGTWEAFPLLLSMLLAAGMLWVFWKIASTEYQKMAGYRLFVCTKKRLYVIGKEFHASYSWGNFSWELRTSMGCTHLVLASQMGSRNDRDPPISIYGADDLCRYWLSECLKNH